MTEYLVPLTVTFPGTGEVIPMPGHPDYVAGTDVTDPFMYWLTRDPADDVTWGLDAATGYMKRSGVSSAAPNTIRFRDTTYWFEYGLNIGYNVNDTAKTDRQGRVWPQQLRSAWRNLIFAGAGQDITILRQQDNTAFNDGVNAVTGQVITDAPSITTPGTTAGTTVILDNALGPTGIARAVGGHVQGQTSTGVSLFTGGAKGATIDHVEPDGKTIVFSAGYAKENRPAGTSLTLYLLPTEPRRDPGVIMFDITSPGSVNGLERAAMATNLTFQDFTIQGGNTAGAISVNTAREFWHGFSIASCDGLTIQRVTQRNLWGDFFFSKPVAQSPLPAYSNTGVEPENVLITDTVNISCGRHALTMQGNTNWTVQRSVFRDIGRLAWDTETTATSARVLNVTVKDCAFDPGTVFWHASPALLYGEPPRTLAVSTTNGSKNIAVPYDTVDNLDFAADISGTGIPAGTYLSRRLDPTTIEMSKAATATGSITATLSSPSLFRDITFDHVDFISGGGFNFCGNTGSPPSRVYFTADLTAGEQVSGGAVLKNITFLPRADGLTFTVDDLLTETCFTTAANLVTPAKTKFYVDTKISSSSVTVKGYDTNSNPTVSLTSALTTAAKTIAGVNTIGATRRVVNTTTAGTWTVADKGRSLPGLGFPSDAVIDTVPGAKQVTMTRSYSGPASSGVTVTQTGPALFYAIIGPSHFRGLTITECRNINTGKWSGQSQIWNALHQPMLMLPPEWDDVTITKNYATAAKNNAGTVVERMVGYFAPPGSVGYGTPSWGDNWTVSNNRWIDALDNQVAGTPTTTVTLTLAADDLTKASPTFTVTGSRSDAGTLRGAVRLLRNGAQQAVAFLGAGGSGNVTVPWSPSPTGTYTWQAVWAGSWDTVSASSNTLTQDVGGAVTTPTTTTITASPSSPQTVGATVTLTATVSPDPGNGTLITFRESGADIGTGTTTSGVATLAIVPAVGIHSYAALYAGNATYQGSTANPISYTINPPVVVDQPPTILSFDPADQEADVPVDQQIGLTFSESVTGVSVRLVKEDGGLVVGTLAGAGADWTFTPAEDLDASSRYTIYVDTAVDSGSNSLTGKANASFSTVLGTYAETVYAQFHVDGMAGQVAVPVTITKVIPLS